MSFALHKEIINSSNINFVLSGKFVEGNKVHLNKIKETLIHQILLVKNSRFDVYEVNLVESDDENMSNNYKYNFLVDYKVYGAIKTAEKIRINQLDSVILVMDYAKIAIIEYDPNYKDF